MAEPSRDTRTPSTDAVLEMVERLEDYLYALRPTAGDEVKAKAPEKHGAAVAAMEAAGLGWPQSPVTGWSEGFVDSPRVVFHTLMDLLRSTARGADEDTAWFLRDQVRFIRDEAYFRAGVEREEARKPDDPPAAMPKAPKGEPIAAFGVVSVYAMNTATVFGRPKRLPAGQYDIVKALVGESRAGRRMKDSALKVVRRSYYRIIEDLTGDPDWAAVIDWKNGSHMGICLDEAPDDPQAM